MTLAGDDDDRDAPMVACGAIEGEPNADDILRITLTEIGGSGFEGRAALQPEVDDDDGGGDDDNDETQVTVGIWPAGSVQLDGTPAS